MIDLTPCVSDGRKHPDQTGRYRRMLAGILPSDETAIRIQKKLGEDQCHILEWRDHPFLRLLDSRPITSLDIQKALLSIRGQLKETIWEYLFVEDEYDLNSTRKRPNANNMHQITGMRNFDTLIALVAFAREAIQLGEKDVREFFIKKSREYFPYVICSNPHLYVRRYLIAKKLNKILWNLEGKLAHQARLCAVPLNWIEEIAHYDFYTVLPNKILGRYK